MDKGNNKDTLVLADGTEIMIEEGSIGMNALCVHVRTKSEAASLWEKLTPGNLKAVQIKDADGTVTGRYEDMLLDHLTGKDKKAGTVEITLCIREKTYAEKLEDRIARIEADQQTHGEAISDLGQAVSDMASEGGE